MENAKVTVILYPDDDGGYTAVMPYFSCHLTTQGNCLTAQGETPDEAMAEARMAAGGLPGRERSRGPLPSGLRPSGRAGGAGAGGGSAGVGRVGPFGLTSIRPAGGELR